MPISDLFSKRQKVYSGEISSPLIFDNLPQPLKVQIFFIVQHTVTNDPKHRHSFFKVLHEYLLEEYGQLSLLDSSFDHYDFSLHSTNIDSESHLRNFFLDCEDLAKLLFFIKSVFAFLENGMGNAHRGLIVVPGRNTPRSAIAQLNKRFKEHGIGYQFTGGQIIRVDSTYAHTEIIKPAISLLTNDKFKGPFDEFNKAHASYLLGDNKQCIAECGKAFESTMKTICNLKNWATDIDVPHNKLLEICLKNELIPSHMLSQMKSLRSLLESGPNVIRNQPGAGHGQGATPIEFDNEITRYALNLTASNIIFLIECSGIK